MEEIVDNINNQDPEMQSLFRDVMNLYLDIDNDYGTETDKKKKVLELIENNE